MTSVKYDFNFLAGFVNEDERIEFNSYSLSLHLYLNTESPIDQQTAFARMDIIMFDIIDNSVFIEEGHKQLEKRIEKTGLQCLTVSEPGPTDQIIQITLVDKLNAITDGVLHIFESEMSSIKGGMVKYIYHSVTDDVAEHTLISTDPRKWWSDPNPRFTTITKKLTDIHNINDVKTWKDFDLEWEDDEVDVLTDVDVTHIDSAESNIITMNIADFPKK